jgi:hypothetical protein
MKVRTKIAISIVAVMMVLSGAHVTYAAEEDVRANLLEQIAELTALIEDLQEQIAQMNAQHYPYDAGQIISDGVEWFKAAQESNGHFRYEYEPFTDSVVEGDHIVRQAGGFYELGEILVRDPEKIHDLSETMQRSAGYFVENSVSGFYNDRSFMCLLQGSDKCTMGGTTLALIGFLDLVQAHPELQSEYGGLIDGYAQFILAMNKPGQGFANFFYRYMNQTLTESSFSNGEALLALVRYYQYKPSEALKDVIDKKFAVFDAYAYDTAYYLWGMAAVKDLYEIEPKEEYVAHVRAYTDWRIEPYKLKRGATRNKCAYFEGVISAYSVLEAEVTEEEKEAYLEEIDYWLSHSADLQVGEGDTMKMTFGTNIATYLTVPKPEVAVGGFLTGANAATQRIDYTQHCLSSYLQKLIDIDGGSFTQSN